MGRKDHPLRTSRDRVKSIIRHIDNANYSVSQCPFHFEKPCFIMLNNFNQERFHCLFAKDSILWKAYSISKSCDIPEHFYDLVQLQKQLGDEYVLPFVRHFRESSGYTIGMFHQDIHLYPPTKIKRSAMKETAITLVVFLCAACRQLGGSAPLVRHFSFVYTPDHPVMCDIGSPNVEVRERISNRKEHFNDKKWTRFMCRKTTRDVIRYLKVVFPHYFQKKQKGKRCILDETEECFDGETHELICHNEKLCLASFLWKFRHFLPDPHLRENVVRTWIEELKSKPSAQHVFEDMTDEELSDEFAQAIPREDARRGGR